MICASAVSNGLDRLRSLGSVINIPSAASLGSHGSDYTHLKTRLTSACSRWLRSASRPYPAIPRLLPIINPF
jgi:hypothetical protein